LTFSFTKAILGDHPEKVISVDKSILTGPLGIIATSKDRSSPTDLPESTVPTIKISSKVVNRDPGGNAPMNCRSYHGLHEQFSCLSKL
jgi:hypothetical protein